MHQQKLSHLLLRQMLVNHSYLTQVINTYLVQHDYQVYKHDRPLETVQGNEAHDATNQTFTRNNHRIHRERTTLPNGPKPSTPRIHLPRPTSPHNARPLRVRRTLLLPQRLEPQIQPTIPKRTTKNQSHTTNRRHQLSQHLDTTRNRFF